MKDEGLHPTEAQQTPDLPLGVVGYLGFQVSPQGWNNDDTTGIALCAKSTSHHNAKCDVQETERRIYDCVRKVWFEESE